MIPFQILPWEDVKKTIPNAQVVHVTEQDFKEFQLPIPGIWKKIIASENTPGLSEKNRDRSFPSRTRVIGIIDNSVKERIVYLKKEVMAKKIVINEEYDFFLIGINNTVNAFKNRLNNTKLNISIEANEIIDLDSKTTWDIRGKYLSGSLNKNLEPIAMSDEYWFSWKKFHEGSKLIRL